MHSNVWDFRDILNDPNELANLVDAARLFLKIQPLKQVVFVPYVTVLALGKAIRLELRNMQNRLQNVLRHKRCVETIEALVYLNQEKTKV